MPKVKYTGPAGDDKKSPKINIGYGRAIAFPAGETFEVDNEIGLAIAKAVKDNPAGWEITGLPEPPPEETKAPQDATPAGKGGKTEKAQAPTTAKAATSEG